MPYPFNSPDVPCRYGLMGYSGLVVYNPFQTTLKAERKRISMQSLVRSQAVEASMLGDMVVMLANGSEKEAVFTDPKHIGLALILGHDPTELVSVTLKAHFDPKANRFLVDLAVDQRMILQVEIPKGDRYSIGFTRQTLDKLAEANHE